MRQLWANRAVLTVLAAAGLLAAACGGKATPTNVPAATSTIDATPTAVLSATATAPLPPTATSAPCLTPTPGALVPTRTAPPVAVTPASGTAAPAALTATAMPCVTGVSISVALAAVGGSGQSGSATLTPLGPQTQVVVSMSGGATATAQLGWVTGTAQPGAAGAAQPAKIRAGSCATPGLVVYGLNSLTSGQSATVINVASQSLQTGGFIVAVSKSDADKATVVACGVIPPVSTKALG